MSSFKYRLIALDDNKVRQFSKPEDVADFLLGRRVSAYIVIQTQKEGEDCIHKVIELHNTEYTEVLEALKSV